jgi:hypothetical protein
MVLAPMLPLGWGGFGTAPSAAIMDGFRVGGEITSVDVEAEAFGLHTGGGEDLRVQVSEDTRFFSRDGEIDGLEDLEPGLWAWVAGSIDDSGAHVAHKVAVGDPGDRPFRPDLRKYRGAIASVSIDESSFDLTTRDGDSLTFLVNDRTKFHSPDGSVTGLADLEVGQAAGVAAVRQDDDSLLAVHVVAGFEKVDRRAAGTIASLGENEFELETFGGETLTIAVDDSTAFKSHDGSLETFEDLEVGMRVLVAVRETDGGGLLAIRVWAGKPGGPKPAPEGG